MKPNYEATTLELRELAEQIGYKVRYEKGDFDGGYCLLKAQKLIVINRKLDIRRKISILSRILFEIGIDDIYIKPALREVIEEEVIKNKV
jgi:hypothetical protein